MAESPYGPCLCIGGCENDADDPDGLCRECHRSECEAVSKRSDAGGAA